MSNTPPSTKLVPKSKSALSIPLITEAGPKNLPLKAASTPPSPTRKLFLRPGTIEEEEEDHPQRHSRLFAEGDSPLILKGPYYVGTPKVPSLARISTCNSSLTCVGTRSETYRLAILLWFLNRRNSKMRF